MIPSVVGVLRIVTSGHKPKKKKKKKKKIEEIEV